MRGTRRLLPALVLASWALHGRPAAADVFDPVGYELEPGSVIVDDCLCERPAIERPLAGTFVLTRLPVKILGELYSLSGIRFSFRTDPASPEYVVKGSGTLHRTGADLALHALTLDLAVDGTDGIQLSSGPASASAPWPELDLTAREDGARDPLHLYSIRIVAAPAASLVPYRVVEGDTASFEGSFFVDDCTICLRPTIPVPIGGTFLLRQTGGGGPNPITTYAVESLDLKTVNGALDYRLLGGGAYQWGGEVALLQSMDLTVSVNQEEGVLLSSGPAVFPVGVRFPEIDIQLEHKNPASELHVYSLHLVAQPVGPAAGVEFRRGDPNGDGALDVSDAVFILFWRFAGGAAPGCLEAADTDGDGIHDLADAVGLLLYLFQSGPEPPAPGVESCGPAKTPVFGCDSYPPCGA